MSVNICEYMHVDRILFWGLLWSCVGSWRAWCLCCMQLVHSCLIHLLLGTMNTIISVFLTLIETEKLLLLFILMFIFCIQFAV